MILSAKHLLKAAGLVMKAHANCTGWVKIYRPTESLTSHFIEILWNRMTLSQRIHIMNKEENSVAVWERVLQDDLILSTDLIMLSGHA